MCIACEAYDLRDYKKNNFMNDIRLVIHVSFVLS